MWEPEGCQPPSTPMRSPTEQGSTAPGGQGQKSGKVQKNKRILAGTAPTPGPALWALEQQPGLHPPVPMAAPISRTNKTSADTVPGPRGTDPPQRRTTAHKTGHQGALVTDGPRAGLGGHPGPSLQSLLPRLWKQTLPQILPHPDVSVHAAEAPPENTHPPLSQ